MKNLILPIFLLATIILMAQDYKPKITLPESKELGLVAYLSHVKTVSEIMLLEKGDDAKKWYFSIKESSDVLINQLCADMTDRRGLKLYRELNKDIGSENYTSKYKFLIEKIDTAFKEIKKTPDENKLSDVLGTLGIEPYSIYKDIVSAKTKKVEGLIAQLKELKLQPLEKKESKGQ
ncbi:hypothetical protein [Flagellimonas crocea]|uniref:hypothetical protein n=1 Tax=Flagellimonas crocea TaxID=3067311 RepID=UPI00296F3B63|nr:hypothetical protein [Muricauda sp. DH64]